MNQRQGVFKTEDWWAVWIGLFIFLLSLGVFVKLDLLGWVAKPAMWVELGKAFGPASKSYTGMSGLMSLFLTYISFVVIFGIGAKAIGLKMKQFFLGFTVIFILTYLCILIGNYANIAVNNPADYKKFGITWSLKLTGEAGLIIALIVGLCISNLMPRFTESLKEAARPEWYIKTAIVILGAAIGVKAVGAMGLATAVMFRGFCAIIEAYLIYWALVYFISRKYFGFSREWAAPLASGISICGVSAAIATGAAIRARPVIPIMVSSLVVIFAVFELIFLPFVAQYFLYDQPLVAGGWMGLAVKTDGAAVASGAIVDSLIRAKALMAQGINYEAGWILSTTTTVKVFIDIFIGVWAFILALVWCYAIDRRPGETVKAIEIWERFPKFIIGYILTFVIMLYVALKVPGTMDTAKAASGEADIFRSAFFALTFLSIGLVTNFRKLWEEGIGKLALVYIVCLFGFITWIGLAISWIFFHGMTPPIIQG